MKDTAQKCGDVALKYMRWQIDKRNGLFKILATTAKWKLHVQAVCDLL